MNKNKSIMDIMDIQAVESKLNDVTVTAIPMSNAPLKLSAQSSQHSPQHSHHSQPYHKSHHHQQQQLQQQQAFFQAVIKHQQKQEQQQQQQLARLSADITTTVTPVPLSTHSPPISQQPPSSASSSSSSAAGLAKYAQLLSVIEEMGRDIRPTYANGRSSCERLKRSIMHAKVGLLVHSIFLFPSV